MIEDTSVRRLKGASLKVSQLLESALAVAPQAFTRRRVQLTVVAPILTLSDKDIPAGDGMIIFLPGTAS
jgi:hypothetical protein